MSWKRVLPFGLPAASGLAAGFLYALLTVSLRPSPDGPANEWVLPRLAWSDLDALGCAGWMAVFAAGSLGLWLGLGRWLAGLSGRPWAQALGPIGWTFLLAWSLAVVLALDWQVSGAKFMTAARAVVLAWMAWIWTLLARAMLGNPARQRLRDVGALFLVLYGGLAVVNQTVNPTGDEPNHLLAAHSLVFDGDFDLLNNYEARDSQRFFRSAALDGRPHGDVRTLSDGRAVLYEQHLPGAAVFMAPGYALAGRFGAQLMVALAAAAALACVYRLLRQLDLQGRPALEGTLAVGLSLPLVVYSSQIYPEMPAALATALAATCLVELPRHSGRHCLVIGLTVAVLPWLALRLAVLAAAIVAAMAVRMRHTVRAWLAFLAPVVPAGLALALYSLHAYGSVNPAAAYGNTGAIRPEEFPMVALGLLFDQKKGLVPYAPIYALVGVGLVLAWRTRRGPAAVLAWLVAVVYVMLVVNGMEWHGGWAPPPRYLVCVMPAAAVLAAVALGRYQRGWRAYATRILAGLSIGVAVLLWCDPGLRYNVFGEAGRPARLFAKLRFLGLQHVWPSFDRAEAADYGLAVGWLAAIVVLSVWLLRDRSQALQ